MKSPRSIAVALLFLALAAVAAVAWRQYGELIRLRAQLADGDNAALKKQLADARKSIRSLEDRLAAVRGRGAAAVDSAADSADGDSPGANPGLRFPGGRFGMFADMAANPEFQKLMAIQMKGRVSQMYGPLFKALNLSPDQLAQFQTLLADKQQALVDVMQAAREQGLNPRADPDGFKTLVNQAVSQVDASIQQALGDAGYQQYQQYQQTLPERNVVSTLQQQLSYTQTPLTDDQANQMVALLAQNQPQRPGGGTAGVNNGGEGGGGPGIFSLMNGGGNAKVTTDAVAQASGVLSAPQVAVLQQIQQQQQAQQQMQQLFRAANQGAAGGNAAPPAPSGGGGKG